MAKVIQKVTPPKDYFQVGENDGKVCVYINANLAVVFEDIAIRQAGSTWMGLLTGRRVEDESGLLWVFVQDAVELKVRGSQHPSAEAWRQALLKVSEQPKETEVVGVFQIAQGGVNLSDALQEDIEEYLDGPMIYFGLSSSNREHGVMAYYQNRHALLSGYRIFGGNFEPTFDLIQPENSSSLESSPSSSSSAEEIPESLEPARAEAKVSSREPSREILFGRSVTERPAVGLSYEKNDSEPRKYPSVKPELKKKTARSKPSAGEGGGGEHYIKRTTEKIYRLVSKVRWTWKDSLWLMLLLSIFFVAFFQQAPSVDFSNVLNGQESMQQELEKTRQEIEEIKQVLRQNLMPINEYSDPDFVDNEEESMSVSSGTAAEEQQQSEGSYSENTDLMVKIHKVATGETIESIAQEFYGTTDEVAVQSLLKYNNIEDATLLQPGQTLHIPNIQDLEP